MAKTKEPVELVSELEQPLDISGIDHAEWYVLLLNQVLLLQLN